MSLQLDNLDWGRLDPGGMRARLEGLDVDARAAWEQAMALPWPRRKPPRALVVLGMGGSAISAELLRGYAESELGFPIHVVRDYCLPAWVGPEDFVIASSYSGNTEETLAAYQDARSRALPRVVFASGGTLRKLAAEDGLEATGYPVGYQPRAALAWGFFTLLGAMVRWGFLGARDREVAAAIRGMETLRSEYGADCPESSNPAKQLARELHARVPVLYAATRRFEPVALRWRQQFQENAKTWSHHNSFPELNHNEIVGWHAPPALVRQLGVVMLRDREDSPRVRLRMDLSRPVFEEAGAGVFEVESRGEGLLERMFSQLVLGDWVSVYLGLLNGVDPTPVTRIDHLKSQLERASAT